MRDSAAVFSISIIIYKQKQKLVMIIFINCINVFLLFFYHGQENDMHIASSALGLKDFERISFFSFRLVFI